MLILLLTLLPLAQRSSAVTPEPPAEVRRAGWSSGACHATPSVPRDAPRLIVELVDERGASVARSDLPPYCAKLPETIRPFSFATRPSPEFDGARWTFPVEPGETYAVGWIHAQHRLVERSVEIDEQRTETLVQLVLGPREAPGEVRLRILDDDGQPFDFEPGAGEWLHTSIRSARTGKVLWDPSSLPLTARGVQIPTDRCVSLPRNGPFLLPPGRYVVRAEPLLPATGCGRAASRRLFHGPDETDVVVVSGTEQNVTLRPWKGGRVRLQVDGLAPQAGEAGAVLQLLPPRPGQTRWRLVEADRCPKLTVLDRSQPAVDVRLVDAPTAEDPPSCDRYVLDALVRSGRRFLTVASPGLRAGHGRGRRCRGGDGRRPGDAARRPPLSSRGSPNRRA